MTTTVTTSACTSRAATSVTTCSSIVWRAMRCIVFTATFAYLINWLPGAAFLLAASLLIGAAGVAWVVTAPSRADDRFA